MDEAVAPEILFGQPVPLYHRTHRAIQDKDAVGQYVFYRHMALIKIRLFLAMALPK
jgi:hypothetical protein